MSVFQLNCTPLPRGRPLRKLALLNQMRSHFPFSGGRYHFFDSTSFNAALSSIASASNRLSLLFSSSSARRRLASLTSRPPYLLFHF